VILVKQSLPFEHLGASSDRKASADGYSDADSDPPSRFGDDLGPLG